MTFWPWERGREFARYYDAFRSLQPGQGFVWGLTGGRDAESGRVVPHATLMLFREKGEETYRARLLQHRHRSTEERLHPRPARLVDEDIGARWKDAADFLARWVEVYGSLRHSPDTPLMFFKGYVVRCTSVLTEPGNCNPLCFAFLSTGFSTLPGEGRRAVHLVAPWKTVRGAVLVDTEYGEEHIPIGTALALLVGEPCERFSRQPVILPQTTEFPPFAPHLN